MCGIAGLFSTSGEAPPASRAHVASMLRAIAHRGPDGEGLESRGPAVLGHRRLSIIDLEGGAQPLSSPSGRVHLVFNGEIYNYLELRPELEALGHVFKTRSDSEVLAAAIDEWGSGCLPKLRGMFAFAAYDAGRRVLLLARDRLGKKPLYYGRRGEAWGFASELPAMLAWPAVERELDPEAIAGYLRHGYVAAPRSAIRGVKKLLPGCFLEVSLQGGNSRAEPEPRAYWSLSYGPKLASRDEAADEVSRLFDEAVRDRLIADVPVGAFLSSGIDSSLVVARASRASRSALRTFTVGFDAEPDHDEREGARVVAALSGALHTEQSVSIDAAAELPWVVEKMGEPLGDPSCLPTSAVARVARGSVKVVLTGDGGDETFAGYGRYARSRISAVYAALPSPLRKAAAGALGALGVGAARLREAESRAERGGARAFAETMQTLDPASVEALLHPDRRPLARPEIEADPLGRLHAEAPASEWLDRLLYTDLKSYLADGVLVKVDRMTMAHGIEARSPLLDHRLVELAARLPSRWKRPASAPGKQLLREVAVRSLPPAVVERPKRGFNLPVDAWMESGPLGRAAREALSRSQLVEAGWLDRAALEAEIGRPGSGRAPIGNRLFSLYVLELWFERVVRAERPKLVEGPAAVTA